MKFIVFMLAFACLPVLNAALLTDVTCHTASCVYLENLHETGNLAEPQNETGAGIQTVYLNTSAASSVKDEDLPEWNGHVSLEPDWFQAAVLFVPEPGSVFLLGLGMAGAALIRRPYLQ